MDIYVYDREINLLGIVDSYSSFTWTRKYDSVGNFELYVPLTIENIGLLKIGNVIRKEDSLEGAVITQKEITLDQTGKEIINIKGKLLGYYLSYRVIKSLFNSTGTIEDLIRNIVYNNAMGLTTRAIPNLRLRPLKGFAETTTYQKRWGNLQEEVESLARLGGLGFKVELDLEAKAMYFDLYKGVDRSTSQNSVAPCIFSRDFENILQEVYTETDVDHKNVAYVGGEGEGLARKVEVVGEGEYSYLDRRELFVDARDLQKQTGQETLTDEEYKQKLIERGKTKLNEHLKIETFEGSINTVGNNVYRSDYELGDIITIEDNIIGVSLDTRITEVQEIYENGKLEINLTFGNSIPTLQDKLKKI